MARFHAITSICSLKSHRISRSATSCAGSRGGPRARSSRSSSISASATGASASGSVATSQPRPETSPTISSCAISTAIPTSKASALRHEPTGVSRSVIQSGLLSVTTVAGHFDPPATTAESLSSRGKEHNLKCFIIISKIFPGFGSRKNV